MGAPPSRTNPDGQPWGYPVLDLERLRRRGARAAHGARRPALCRLRRPAHRSSARPRLPVGVRRDDRRPAAAVMPARACSARPTCPTIRSSRRFAIARADQLDRSRRACAGPTTGCAHSTTTQVARYGALFDASWRACAPRASPRGRRRVRGAEHVAVPLAPRDGALRPRPLRVTQKANLARADDVYRSDNALAARLDHGRQPRHAADLAPVQPPGTAADGDGARARPRGAPRATPPARGLRARRSTPTLATLPRPVRRAVPRARRVACRCSSRISSALATSTTAPASSTTTTGRLRSPPDFAEAYARDSARATAFNVPLALALALAARADVKARPALLPGMIALAPRRHARRR